jgi:hypothetical protein
MWNIELVSVGLPLFSCNQLFWSAAPARQADYVGWLPRSLFKVPQIARTERRGAAPAFRGAAVAGLTADLNRIEGR